MVKFTEINEEILYTVEPITKVSKEDIELLKRKAAGNKRKRIRLCSHPNVNDPLHEMLIVHAKGAYVRPHKHVQKSESFHVIDGTLTVVIFDDEGSILEVVNMSDYTSDKKFYYRLSDSLFHTVVPESDFVVFHETTNGPFQREDTQFAAWAPEEDDVNKQKVYLKKLTEEIENE